MVFAIKMSWMTFPMRINNEFCLFLICFFAKHNCPPALLAFLIVIQFSIKKLIFKFVA